MGIKEWFEPQISEHWPKNCPKTEGATNNWLIRPGIASTFKPIEGTAKEWITSVEEIKRREVVLTGTKRSEEEDNKRGKEGASKSTIESNSKPL